MNNKLFRTSGSEAMILGVCGGLGKYFNIDATIVRVAAAVLLFGGMFMPGIVYIIMAFVVPKENTAV